jgi:hypothetical protein
MDTPVMIVFRRLKKILASSSVPIDLNLRRGIKYAIKKTDALKFVDYPQSYQQYPHKRQKIGLQRPEKHITL